MCREERRGVAKISSSRRTRRRSGPSPRRSRPSGIRASGALSGRVGHARCARRSPRNTGSIPSASSAAAARTSCSRCSPTPISSPGDEAVFSRARVPGLPDRDLAAGGEAGGRPGDGLHAPTSTRCSRASRRGRKIVFLANPNNPTGTYLPYDEVQAPARGPAAARAAGARCGLCRICAAATTTRPGLELVATADNVVMTRTFSKIYGLAGLRLGWSLLPGARRRRAEPHARARSTSTAPALAAGVGGARGRRACRAGGRAQRAMAGLADRRDRRRSGSR